MKEEWKKRNFREQFMTKVMMVGKRKGPGQGGMVMETLEEDFEEVIDADSISTSDYE